MFWEEKVHQIHTVSLVVASSWEDSVRTREINDRTESLDRMNGKDGFSL